MDEKNGFDPKRRLCPDGSCTGIVGPDGRCGECGRIAGAPFTNDAGASPFDAPSGTGTGSDETEAPAVPEGASAPAEGTSADAKGASGEASGFDARRRLCDDGTCVGVVGPNGACTVCGRVAG